jgi:hypothetical protein
MDDAPSVHLVLLQGGRASDDGEPGERLLSREDLRVIPGGPEGDVQAAIERTVQAAREMRREIEERIARELEELF